MNRFLDYIEKKLKELSKVLTSKAVEVSLLSLTFWWGIILVLPSNTFENAKAYEVIKQMASETTWGILIFSVGVGHLIGLGFAKKAIRSLALLTEIFMWLFIAFVFLLADHATTATGTYLVISFLCAYVYAKAGD